MTDLATPRIKVKAQILIGDTIAIGPGKADLLDAIERTGSIAAAGRELGISYRRTRDMIDIANTHWGTPLVETAKGGTSHGGSRLSPHGQEVLTAYRQLESALNAASAEHAAALMRLLNPPSG